MSTAAFRCTTVQLSDSGRNAESAHSTYQCLARHVQSAGVHSDSSFAVYKTIVGRASVNVTANGIKRCSQSFTRTQGAA